MSGTRDFILVLSSVCLIISGFHLMLSDSAVLRVFGTFSVLLGYIGISFQLAQSTQSEAPRWRVIFTLLSILFLLLGTVLMYIHMNLMLSQRKSGNYSIPTYIQSIIYAGFAGLSFSISLRSDDTLNISKAIAVFAVFLLVGFVKIRLLTSIANKSSSISLWQVAQILSWLLLVPALLYA